MRLLMGTLFIVGLMAFNSCSNNKANKGETDDILTGNLPVSVDETLLPIFLEQKEVFESSYTDAKIVPLPKTEVSAINALISGEAKIAFLSRQLTEVESRSFKNRSIQPRIYQVAYDGIVLVGNSSGVDTSFTIDNVLSLMNGQSVANNKLVFDNLNSSIFRYFQELGKIEKIPNTHIEAKGSSLSVLEEVGENKDKIGLISLNQYLSLESSFNKRDKIRILSVRNDSLKVNQYVKPSQASLSTGEYPLKREIFVLNYQPNLGLGIGFSAFMTGDRGQRIVLKSGLLPTTMPGREIIIRDGIN